MNAYEQLSAAKRKKLATSIVSTQQASFDAFVKSLSHSVSRQLDRIMILALHHEVHESPTIDDAIQFIQEYVDDGRQKPIDRYEIEVRYKNGDSIRGSFSDKDGAVEFLKLYQPVPPQVV